MRGQTLAIFYELGDVSAGTETRASRGDEHHARRSLGKVRDGLGQRSAEGETAGIAFRRAVKNEAADSGVDAV
ncbi:hypothetical protein D9M70_626590 [compost metagenome]